MNNANVVDWLKVDGLTWVFENKTTGEEMVCNDIGFLLYQMRIFLGIVLTSQAILDLRSKGVCVWEVIDSDDNVYRCTLVNDRVTIEKDPLLKGFYDGD